MTSCSVSDALGNASLRCAQPALLTRDQCKRSRHNSTPPSGTQRHKRDMLTAMWCRCRYTPFHAYILVIVTLVVYAYMAGEYPFWMQHSGRPITRPDLSPGVGPTALARWLRESGMEWRAFNPYFLVRTHCALVRMVVTQLWSVLVLGAHSCKSLGTWFRHLAFCF